MKFAKVYKNGTLLADEIELANSFMKRFLGLMFRKSMPQNHGLLLTPCNAIHTFSMKFAIDAVFLTKDGTVVYIENAMRPNKTGRTIKNAASVLELNAGLAEKVGIQTGDKLEILTTDHVI